MPGQSTDETLSLCLSVQTLGPEIVVTATGELDLASASAVTAMFAEVVTETCRRVVIDGTGLTFLDAAGLRALRAGPARGDGGVEICFRAPSRPVRRVLELTDMCGLIETPVAAPDGDEHRMSAATKTVMAPEGD